MIKGLNDIVSLFVLIILTIFGLRVLFFSFSKNIQSNNTYLSRRNTLSDYINNEEE